MKVGIVLRPSSPDLLDLYLRVENAFKKHNAKVYLDKAFMDEKEQNEALKQLRKVGAYLQNHCKQSEGWFKAPIFTFEFDHQLEEVSRIEDLFKQIAGRNSKKEANDKKDSTDES